MANLEFLFGSNLQSTIRAILNNLGHIRDVCSFEDIGQFHLNARSCRRKQNFENYPT